MAPIKDTNVRNDGTVGKEEGGDVSSKFRGGVEEWESGGGERGGVSMTRPKERARSNKKEIPLQNRRRPV